MAAAISQWELVLLLPCSAMAKHQQRSWMSTSADRPSEKKEVRATIWLCLHRSYTHLRSAAFVMIPGLQRLGTEKRAPHVSGMNSRSLQVQERLCKDTLKDFQVSDYVYMSSVPLYSDRTVSCIRCIRNTLQLQKHWLNIGNILISHW